MVVPTMRSLETALFIGTSSGCGTKIVRVLEEEWGMQVRRASTFAEALVALAPPLDLVLLEVPLADGDAVALARSAARLRPAPLQLALGGNGAETDAFVLGQVGVHGYLTHPFSSEQLSATLRQALVYAPDLTPIVQTVVGQRGLSEVQQEVREVMVTQAFARAGSRVGAARLLKVTRQAVQQALRGSALLRPNDHDVEGRPLSLSSSADSVGS
jgi:DNA-binding response OmpR family regulator